MFKHQDQMTTVALPTTNDFWNKCSDYSMMFEGCQALGSLNIEDQVNGKQNYFGINATTMRDMYYDCMGLSTVNINSTLFGKNATDLSGMFAECSSLSTFKLNAKSTLGQKATDLSYMFYYNYLLKSVNFQNNYLGTVATNVEGMFDCCYELTSANLFNFFVNSNPVDEIYVEDMLNQCNSLSSLTLGEGWYGNGIKMDRTSLEDSPEDLWYNNIVGEGQQASQFPDVATEQVGVWNKNSAKAIYDPNATGGSTLKFVYDHETYSNPNQIVYILPDELKTGYMVGQKLSPVSGGSGGHISYGGTTTTTNEAPLARLVLPPWYTIENGTSTSAYKIRLNAPAKTVIFDSSFYNYHPHSLSCWFMADSYGTSAFQNFKSVNVAGAMVDGFESLNTSEVESFASMFGGFAYNLCGVNTGGPYPSGSGSAYVSSNSQTLSIQDTYNTDRLTLNISTLNIDGSMSNPAGIFANCSALRNVTLKNSMETNGSIQAMFYNCSSLTSTDNISNWNTIDVDYQNVNVKSVFYNCSSLQKADLSNWVSPDYVWTD